MSNPALIVPIDLAALCVGDDDAHGDPTLYGTKDFAAVANDFSVLPNRVFSIGYVRAYAGALGLDEQLAVERFKRESPDPSVPLQPPVGVAFEEVKRYSPRLIAAALALVLAVVGWNVFQARATCAACTGLPPRRQLSGRSGQTIQIWVCGAHSAGM